MLLASRSCYSAPVSLLGKTPEVHYTMRIAELGINLYAILSIRTSKH
jgi:hypothetical protein